MEWKDFEAKENEKPLEKLLDDGGFAAIFRRIACVGDSLSSGEFEAIKPDGGHSYHDFYEYSWGQFLGRMLGAEVYNFSQGGMTAKAYINSFAAHKGFWDRRFAAQAYIIALGVNDIMNQGWEIGSLDDVDFNDWQNNKDTFAGYYTAIVQRYREIQPHARFFFVTMPRSGGESEERAEKRRRHAEFLYALAEKIPYAYVIDLHKYAPVYDEDFTEKFRLVGHLNPMGYMVTAKMIASYMDYIIRKDLPAFKQVGFIGHPQYDEKMDK